MTSTIYRSLGASLFAVLIAAVIGGCSQTSIVPSVIDSAAQTLGADADDSSQALTSALASQSEEAQARFDARNPEETLSFFGIEPGMTVAEALPGGGWYTKILVPYLGSEGGIYGVNYPESLWKSFGYDDEKVAQRVAATAAFPARVAEFSDSGIAAKGFAFNELPSDAEGQADAVLFIRALHNLHRFKDSGVLDDAIEATHAMLKPGGIVGVVQHRAPENAPDEWATGRAGYLKPSAVIAMFTQSGFVLDGSSEINANANDNPNPTTDDVVWRLPPSYAGGEDTKDAMDAIGESDRMTLRFKKI